MSYRHVHVTSFLYDDPDRVEAFIDAARRVDGDFFSVVMPLRRTPDDQVRAVALFSKDLDGISDELDMPRVAEALSGILEHDIDIVSAWEGGDFRRPGAEPRERVWLVRGAKSREPVPGEVVRRQIEA